MLSKKLVSISAAMLLATSAMAENTASPELPKLTDEQALAQSARMIYDQTLFVSTYCQSHLPPKDIDYKKMIAHVEGLLGKDNLEMEIPGYVKVMTTSNYLVKTSLLEPSRVNGELTRFCTQYVEGYSKLDKDTFWKTANKAADQYKKKRDSQ